MEPQLVEKIRGSLNKDMPIIIITTEKAEEKHTGGLGLSLGANEHITKPVNSYELKRDCSKISHGRCGVR